MGGTRSRAKRAGQVWVEGEPKVRLYSTAEAALKETKSLKSRGTAVRVTFVHDRGTGLKLFADRAWYVAEGQQLSAFLLKADAQKWARDHNGKVSAYTEVIASL